MANQDFLWTLLLSTLVAAGPFLALTVYVARGKGDLWKGFFFGWLGWLLALIVRIIPVQLPLVLYPTEIAGSVFLSLVYFGFASAMAGVFEEGFRFFFLRLAEAPTRHRYYPLAFGLGWGIGEAFILYTGQVALLPLVLADLPSFVDLLPGAVERNLAIVAHVSLTFIVMRSLAARKAYLGLAMFLHFGLNFATGSALLLTQNVWIIELIIAVMVVGIFLIALYIRRKGLEAERAASPVQKDEGESP